ncbi:unnamed protein product [Moneuplotes crassus]|uniref:Uncharacterized protein n=1 Tax=Euplotes crassus TaxID=5936 RepID=A0AAD1XH32_EUPCR|nr:unnamed protein product [Moneuplotes crassus]
MPRTSKTASKDQIKETFQIPPRVKKKRHTKEKAQEGKTNKRRKTREGSSTRKAQVVSSDSEEKTKSRGKRRKRTEQEKKIRQQKRAVNCVRLKKYYENKESKEKKQEPIQDGAKQTENSPEVPLDRVQKAEKTRVKNAIKPEREEKKGVEETEKGEEATKKDQSKITHEDLPILRVSLENVKYNVKSENHSSQSKNSNAEEKDLNLVKFDKSLDKADAFLLKMDDDLETIPHNSDDEDSCVTLLGDVCENERSELAFLRNLIEEVKTKYGFLVKSDRYQDFLEYLDEKFSFSPSTKGKIGESFNAMKPINLCVSKLETYFCIMNFRLDNESIIHFSFKIKKNPPE